MIPSCFSAYYSSIPLLNEVTEWSMLRKWSLSEVYRVRLATGETRIIKWGNHEMAKEAEIYHRLVHPLGIKAPEIFEYVQLRESGVMVMEDAGKQNLEQHPLPLYFLEASRELALLRAKATAKMDTRISKKVMNHYFSSQDHFIMLLDELLQSYKIADSGVLLKLKKGFPRHLEKLYQTVPTTIIHHDFHAKNLLIQEDGVMPIDWSSAYLSPHLGDLYCLVNEAHSSVGLSREDILLAYLEVAADPMVHVNWQFQIGGLCWLIKTLHWLVYGGTDLIPGSESWIPDLLKDVEVLYQEME